MGEPEGQQFGDVSVDLDGDTGIATMEIRRAPENYFDADLIRSLADASEWLDERAECRAILLCSEGRHFCAGARLAPASQPDSAPVGRSSTASTLYHEAARLVACRKPTIAVVQGAAIGGGLGLACVADFRVAAPEARFSANFARLGFHHGFGLTVTLPPLVGRQATLELLYTGRRIDGEQALRLGLVDRLVPLEALRDEARRFALEIAASAPLAVQSIRATMRADLVEQFSTATAREAEEQERLRRTADWSEGVRAMAERREPRFRGA